MIQSILISKENTEKERDIKDLIIKLEKL